AAKTGAFMALMIRDTYEPRDERIFREGMRKLDDTSKDKYGVSFVKATPDQRLVLLQVLDREQFNLSEQRKAEAKRKSDEFLSERQQNPPAVAVASPTRGNAEAFAQRHGIPKFYSDYREMLRDPAVEMISITAPNKLHAQMTIDAARAGKHVVCEKPLCMTLEEADAMIDAC